MSGCERDLRAMMDLVVAGERDDQSAGEPLPWSVLNGLMSLIPCDGISSFVLDSNVREASQMQELPVDPIAADPAAAATAEAVFFRHYWESPSCSYPDRTGDLESVLRTSDHESLRQLRGSAMWSEYMRPYGFVRELMVCLAGVPGRTLRILLARGPGLDFTDRDRNVMWLLRPHLYGLHRRRRAARVGRVDLTPRQRTLLSLVAAGHTNRQIGRHLGVSESTARKHLEHIFERLQVNSRAAAVARAFPDCDQLHG